MPALLQVAPLHGSLSRSQDYSSGRLRPNVTVPSVAAPRTMRGLAGRAKKNDWHGQGRNGNMGPTGGSPQGRIFWRLLGHELRNPLAPLQNGLELLALGG